MICTTVLEINIEELISIRSGWHLPYLRRVNVRGVAMVTAIGPHDMGSLPAIPASGTLPEKGDRQHAFWERGLPQEFTKD